MFNTDPIYNYLHNDLRNREFSEEKTLAVRTLKNALKSVRAANRGVRQCDRIEFVCINHYNRGCVYIPATYISNLLECVKLCTTPAVFIDDEYMCMIDGTFRAQWPIYLDLPNDVRFYQYSN